MALMTRAEFQIAVEDILKVPRGSLKETDSRDTLENWSSFVDVEILEFVAQRFGIEPEADLMEAETFGDLVRMLEQKRAFAL
jgi:acyl carrier protein